MPSHSALGHCHLIDINFDIGKCIMRPLFYLCFGAGKIMFSISVFQRSAVYPSEASCWTAQSEPTSKSSVSSYLPEDFNLFIDVQQKSYYISDNPTA